MNVVRAVFGIGRWERCFLSSELIMVFSFVLIQFFSRFIFVTLGMRVECRVSRGREPQHQLPEFFYLWDLHFPSTLFPRLSLRHFFFIVPIELVKIPMISSRRVIRC